MIIFVLISIVIIIYIYLKYYSFTKEEVKIEEIEKYDSIFIGYLKEKGISNNYDLILAEIIDLSTKGYVKIKYDSDKFDKYFYTITLNTDEKSTNLTKYEMLILNFLFSSKMEISKNELEEKLKESFKTYNIQFNEIKQVLREKAIKEKIIDIKKEKELPIFKKMYIIISIIVFIIIGILGTLNIISINMVEMFVYLFEQILIIFLLSKASIYTNKGQNIKYTIDEYKINIKNEEYLVGNNTMQEIVENKTFANSIALNINTLAKEAFMSDVSNIEAISSAKKTAIYVFLGLLLFIIIGFAIAKLSVTLPKDAVVWIFILFAISVAVVADVTLMKNKK